MTVGSNPNFELHFEGPEDDRPETIRKLKAAFLVDLNLPLERVQEIFASTPTVIMSADSKMDLEDAYSLIRSAGGKVALVQGDSQDSDDNSLEFDTSDFESVSLDQDDSEEDLDDGDVFDPGIKTYELTTEDEDTEELLPQMLVKQTVMPQTPRTAPQPDNELKLGEAMDEGLLLDSPVKKEDPATSFKDSTPIPEPKKVEAAPLIQEKSTAVEMVLKDLNSELIMEDPHEDPQPPVKAPPAALTKAAAHAVSFETEKEEADLIPAKEPEEAPAKESAPVAATIVTGTVQAEVPFKPLKTAAKKESLLKAITPPVAQSTEQIGGFANVMKPKTAVKSALMDFLVPILIGSVLVLAGNYYFMNSNPASDADQLEKAVSSLAAMQKDTPAESATPKEAAKKFFAGETTYENHSFSGDVTNDVKGKKVFVTVKFQTPEPPQLTAEQIGRREKRLPWLRIIETDKVGLAVNEDGSFKGTLQARIYVEDNNLKTRQLMATTVLGQISADGTVQLEAQLGTLPEDQKYQFQRIEMGKYQVAIKGGASLKQVATQ